MFLNEWLPGHVYTCLSKEAVGGVPYCDVCRGVVTGSEIVRDRLHKCTQPGDATESLTCQVRHRSIFPLANQTFIGDNAVNHTWLNNTSITVHWQRTSLGTAYSTAEVLLVHWTSSDGGATSVVTVD